MANSWLRLWHELPNDPKWRVIARSSGQPIPSVISVFLHLLVSASQNEKRGVTQYNAEDVAAALDLETKCVEAIVESMQGRVLDEGRITGWGKRQPIREDFSAERVKKWRERSVTQCNAPDKDKEKIKKVQKPSAKGKPSQFLLPAWIDSDSWAGFEEMRRKIRAPLTNRARNGIIKELQKMCPAGNDAAAILDQSTNNSWRGVFPLRANGNGGNANVRSGKNQPSPAKQRIDGARRVLAEIAISRGLYDPASANGRPDAQVSEPRPAGERR